MSLLSSLTFAALLQYSSIDARQGRGNSAGVRDQIKRANKIYLERAAARLKEATRPGGPLEAFWDADAVLVPVPGHAPQRRGALWTPLEICKALVEHNLAKETAPLLRRHRAVPKSAFSAPEDRPTCRSHFDSMSVIPELPIETPDCLILVDDVVTRGATLLAAASKLSIAFPASEIRGFAVLRAITDRSVEDFYCPVEGTVVLRDDGNTLRRP